MEDEKILEREEAENLRSYKRLFQLFTKEMKSWGNQETFEAEENLERN